MTTKIPVRRYYNNDKRYKKNKEKKTATTTTKATPTTTKRSRVTVRRSSRELTAARPPYFSILSLQKKEILKVFFVSLQNPLSAKKKI